MIKNVNVSIRRIADKAYKTGYVGYAKKIGSENR